MKGFDGHAGVFEGLFILICFVLPALSTILRARFVVLLGRALGDRFMWRLCNSCSRAQTGKRKYQGYVRRFVVLAPHEHGFSSNNKKKPRPSKSSARSLYAVSSAN